MPLLWASTDGTFSNRRGLLAENHHQGATNRECSESQTIATTHARMFFNRPDLDLATAARGSYPLVPHTDMLANFEQDYNAMSQMIFGEIPAFAAIIESVVSLEKHLNRIRTSGG